jgi:hypothetical protein
MRGVSQPATAKLAANYLAFVQLASIRPWPRANESTSQTARPYVAFGGNGHPAGAAGEAVGAVG